MTQAFLKMKKFDLAKLKQAYEQFQQQPDPFRRFTTSQRITALIKIGLTAGFGLDDERFQESGGWP
ncbi:hypothetical protein [Desulfonatronum parangueonense]